MSKNKMSTEEKIVSKALEMFNERGIEYVGLREIAATLDMRVGNITYYFPTKDDLVNRLSLDLNRLNAEIVIDEVNLSLSKFLNILNQVFHNHVKYRCLLLSFVHLLDQNKLIAARYESTQKDRNAVLKKNMNSLVESGFLKFNEETQIEYIVSMMALIIRFWLSEANVSFKHLSSEKQIQHYLNLVGQLLMPYCTAKGKKEISIYLGTI
ncbi:MAG: TetR family transcriptional regulator [Chitinophagaceae bacterium]|nr:TetR family transcriptional regulator [Chitinophagaceae bacterium]